MLYGTDDTLVPLVVLKGLFSEFSCVTKAE